MHLPSIFVAIILVSCACVVVAQTNRRCFQFTWLGPRYSNESVFQNATCQDATRLSNGIPCNLPLVVSNDGSWPDVDYIWENYQQGATCELADTHVCAQYTYYFNGLAVNSTYMCTQAVDNFGNAITSGCYQQTNGTFSTRVCFCRSLQGARPCNDAGLTSVLSTSAFVISLIIAMKGIDIRLLKIF